LEIWESFQKIGKIEKVLERLGKCLQSL
jgi:hypothetical protein